MKDHKTSIEVQDSSGFWATSWVGRASKIALQNWLKNYALSLRAGEVSYRHFVKDKGFKMLPIKARILSVRTGKVLVKDVKL